MDRVFRWKELLVQNAETTTRLEGAEVDLVKQTERGYNCVCFSPGNSLKNTSSPDCGRSPKRGSFNSFGSLGVTYDPTSESLTLTRANHSAIQHDIIGLKTMLLTLRRVLSEASENRLSASKC